MVVISAFLFTSLTQKNLNAVAILIFGKREIEEIEVNKLRLIGIFVNLIIPNSIQ